MTSLPADFHPEIGLRFYRRYTRVHPKKGEWKVR